MMKLNPVFMRMLSLLINIINHQKSRFFKGDPFPNPTMTESCVVFYLEPAFVGSNSGMEATKEKSRATTKNAASPRFLHRR